MNEATDLPPAAIAPWKDAPTRTPFISWPMAETHAGRALENMTTALLLFDRGLTLRWMNPAAEMLFKIGRRQVGRAGAAALFQAGGDLENGLRLALDKRRPYAKREIHLRTADGDPLTIDGLFTPLMDERQEDAVLAECAQVDRQLRISREEDLINREAATRTLARGLAHEIKNPLGGLRGAAQLLERELPGDELREYTRVIIAEADRLQNLVDRMLGPHVRPDFKPLNVHEVLERVRALILAETDDRIAIDRDYDPSMPELTGDLDMLIQATLNLARNAAEAIGQAPSQTPETKGEILLRTRVHRQHTIGPHRHRLVARIDIIDNGPGVPPELAQRLFYPMVTGRKGGSGLGLSIAQTLINHHQGLIEYESRPGHTVFTLLLPLGGRPDETQADTEIFTS